VTLFSEIIQSFLSRIEKDKDFFTYFELSDEEAMDLARKRASIYLHEAISIIMAKGQPSVDFTDFNLEVGEFNFELTAQEKFLLSSLMYEMYLSRDIAYLRCLSVNYTSTDLRVFDPSSARSTFMDMYKFVCNQNESFINLYKNTDRLSGAYKGIDYTQYTSIDD